MKISLGMPIPDLGSLPGSRPGGGGNALFVFDTSATAQSDGQDACDQSTNTARYKSTSSSTPIAVGNIIFREEAGETYPAVGYYKDKEAGYYQLGDDGEVTSIGSCDYESFDSTTEAEANNESICEASVEGKMYKFGSSTLLVGDIIYKDVSGSETAGNGFYKAGTGKYYQVDSTAVGSAAGKVTDIQQC
jgi:hypothetical protein|tara:strand:+ start:839 stop:1408 length:570 start_codon:yes stop_codon:yes gene_type:complete